MSSRGRSSKIKLIWRRLRRGRHFSWFLGAAGFGALLAVAGISMLRNIQERMREERESNVNVVLLTEQTDDPSEWGKNFPLEYETYLKTVDQVRTRYGGSEAQPRQKTVDDPRTVVSQSRLAEDPRLVKMWAGYAFSKDFREERGHAFMLEDQLYTERQRVVKQPGTCLNCHASTVKAMRELGGGDLNEGFKKLNAMPYSEAKNLVKHPVSCLDCHQPKTMELRVTRPAFIQGIREYQATLGHKDFDVNRDASRAQMRTFVCAQCHVEYYFKGPEKTLTFPWAKGVKADQILSYYEENKHKDWEHKETGAPVLKAQHPEFELYSQGIHARSGVSCVDCHMPYKREGAKKFTDHQARSPVLNLAHACQTCHRWPEQELKDRIEIIQERTQFTRNLAMNALMSLIDRIKNLKLEIEKKESPASQQVALLKEAQEYQRKAQFLLDFIEAENSSGFHAPGEALRVLSQSLDYSRKGIEALTEAPR